MVGGAGAVVELAALHPLAFGAAWKVLDLLLALSLSQAEFTTGWPPARIDEKVAYANRRRQGPSALSRSGCLDCVDRPVCID